MCRITIRDVLWLTALVAMGAGWWSYGKMKDLDCTESSNHLRWMISQMEKAADRAGYQFTVDNNAGLSLTPARTQRIPN